jgi:hypothetical protein
MERVTCNLIFVGNMQGKGNQKECNRNRSVLINVNYRCNVYKCEWVPMAVFREHDTKRRVLHKTVMFRKLLCPSPGILEDTVLGPLDCRCLIPHSPDDGNRSSLRNVVFASSGRWTTSKTPVILSIIRHRQNPLESSNVLTC